MLSSAARADGKGDDSAITMPGDKPPRPPRLDAPVELASAMASLCSFTSSLPMGRMLCRSWVTMTEPPAAPGGIVIPGDKPPKGPR
jgi:hypothetical protein